jgi:hypothetical protein
LTDILPTHHCFDDALDLLTERVREDRSSADRLRLVHGIATADDGHLYAHAWLEEDAMCWDAGLLDNVRVWFSIARDEFYNARRIIATTSYTVAEALRENWRSGHYGPWQPAYRMLCGVDARIMGRIAATDDPPK